MLLSLLYMVLRVVFRLAPAGDERDREVEILVLRHQVKVLSRKCDRPMLRRIDKLFLSAAARILPRERWSSFILTPATLLPERDVWVRIPPRARACFSLRTLIIETGCHQNLRGERARSEDAPWRLARSTRGTAGAD